VRVFWPHRWVFLLSSFVNKRLNKRLSPILFTKRLLILITTYPKACLVTLDWQKQLVATYSSCLLTKKIASWAPPSTFFKINKTGVWVVLLNQCLISFFELWAKTKQSKDSRGIIFVYVNQILHRGYFIRGRLPIHKTEIRWWNRQPSLPPVTGSSCPTWATNSTRSRLWLSVSHTLIHTVETESLTGREASTATSPLHPTNQRCWFHASLEPAHTAGVGCRLSPNEALYPTLDTLFNHNKGESMIGMGK